MAQKYHKNTGFFYFMYEDTVLLKFPFYCPKRNQKTNVNVVRLRMTVESEYEKHK